MSIWGLWNNIKETSEKVYNVYKEDLQEFTTSIRKDTKEAISQSGQVIQKVVNEGAQQISNITQTDPTDDTGEHQPSSPSGTDHFRSFTSKIKSEVTASISAFFSEYPAGSAQANEQEEIIFINDPENIDTFLEWSSTFDLDSYTDEISALLYTDKAVRDLHSRLVPSKVNYADFWKRYFFNNYELQQIEKKRALLLDKATAAINEEEDPDEFSWGDDDDLVVGSPSSDRKLYDLKSSLHDLEVVDSEPGVEEEVESFATLSVPSSPAAASPVVASQHAVESDNLHLGSEGVALSGEPVSTLATNETLTDLNANKPGGNATNPLVDSIDDEIDQLLDDDLVLVDDLDDVDINLDDYDDWE